MATVERVWFAVLGPLEVLGSDGAPVEIPGAKERLLLAVLVSAAPGVASADVLEDVLWDGDPPPSARKSLQSHVVRLRSALEPGRPRGSSGQYVLRRGTGYALAVGRSDADALLIGDRAARGRSWLASGQYADAARDLESAVALWRGQPYAEWPDAAFAGRERRRLGEVHAGALAGLIEARLQLGRHADVLPELERLVAEEPLREDWWRLLVLALYRAGRQADALAAGRRARAVLAEELGADPGPALRAMEAAVLAQDPGLDRVPTSVAPATGAADLRAAAPGACPYKGLAAYQVADAPLFHGRRQLVSALVARLVDASLVVVSGPSGAGKSSVVRAGLVPALAGGALPGSVSWSPVLLAPGARPVDSLAPLTGEHPPAAPVLLVCDQFEEVWGPEVDPRDRTAFLDAVLGLLDDGVVVRCVLVVRGDHVGRLAEHPALAERVGGALVLVPPVTDPELREIVQEPARAVGLAVEPELLDAVAADGLGRPGALPLLSTALVGTWERRSGDVLTLAGYLRSGGVTGALTRSAETAYGALDDEGQETARRLLVRLADVDDGGALVRRRVPLTELDLDGEGGPGRRAVVEAFVGRRLLAVDADRLEVAHEALLTEWPRLARWLEEDAEGRAVRRHLDPAAREWARTGRPEDDLYRGARLAAALDWAGAAGTHLTPVEREFLEASRVRSDAELAAARDRADREGAGRRRTRRLATGLAAVLVVALVVAVLAVRSARDAERASLAADAGRLAALSATAGLGDAALLLAVQALRLADTPETRNALLGAIVSHGRAVRTAPVPFGARALAWSAEGAVLLTTDVGTYSWSTSDGDEPRPRPPASDPSSNWRGMLAQDASPDEALLIGVGVTADERPWVGLGSVSGDRDLVVGDRVGGLPLAVSFRDEGGAAVVLLAGAGRHGRPAGRASWRLVEFDVSTGSRRELGIAGSADGDVRQADIADDAGTAVVVDGSGSTATLVSVGDGTRVPLQVPSRTASSVGFRALPSGAAQLWSDGQITLYRADGRPLQQLDTGAAPVADVVVSADGRWAATVGAGGSVVLWDVDPVTGSWMSREELVGHVGDVLDADAAPTGDRLATLGRDDSVIVWDVTPGGGFGEPLPGLANRALVGRPQPVDEGRLLVGLTRRLAGPAGPGNGTTSGPDDVSATFFDPDTGEVVDEVDVGTIAPEATSGNSSLSVSPDGTMVAVTTGSATTVLDTGTRRRLGSWDTTVDVLAPDGRRTREPGVSCLGWMPDSALLLQCALARDSTLEVVDPRRGEVERHVRDALRPQAIATSPDDRFLAVADLAQGWVLVKDARTLATVQIVEVDGAYPAHDIVFSPDGRRLALASGSGLDLIDTETWTVARAPAPLTGPLVQAEWFPGGRALAVVGIDGALMLFDVEQGQASALPLPTAERAGDGGTRLVPGISDELVVLGGALSARRYPLDTEVWLARACEVAGRDLTRDEWARYVPDRAYRATCSDLR